MYCAKYKFSTGQFLGLHETVGLIVVTGDDDEVFFNYGYDKVNSELLYSYQKWKIPNSFSGTLINRWRIWSSVVKCQLNTLTVSSSYNW